MNYKCHCWRNPLFNFQRRVVKVRPTTDVYYESFTLPFWLGKQRAAVWVCDASLLPRQSKYFQSHLCKCQFIVSTANSWQANYANQWFQGKHRKLWKLRVQGKRSHSSPAASVSPRLQPSIHIFFLLHVQSCFCKNHRLFLSSLQTT